MGVKDGSHIVDDSGSLNKYTIDMKHNKIKNVNSNISLNATIQAHFVITYLYIFLADTLVWKFYQPVMCLYQILTSNLTIQSKKV